MKKYETDEERLAARRESKKRWEEKHKKERAEYRKQYRQTHKEEIAEYNNLYYHEHKEEKSEYFKQYYQTNNRVEYYKQYRQTQMGRALCLVNNYRRNDKKYNRGECTLTSRWVVENIFTQKCHYCYESDWSKMGCDRIDNELPHTPDNVVPCCDECNKKRGTMTYDEFKKQMGQA